MLLHYGIVQKNFLNFTVRYLTAIISDVTRITIQASNTNTNPV
jgi:hypothetical protein